MKLPPVWSSCPKCGANPLEPKGILDTRPDGLAIVLVQCSSCKDVGVRGLTPSGTYVDLMDGEG